MEQPNPIWQTMETLQLIIVWLPLVNLMDDFLLLGRIQIYCDGAGNKTKKIADSEHEGKWNNIDVPQIMTGPS